MLHANCHVGAGDIDRGYVCRLLYSVLPPTVANELRHGRPVGAKKFESVTILFSGELPINFYLICNVI